MKKFIIGLLLLSTTALADLTGSTLKVVSVSSNYTVTKFDDVVLVDASGGARTITLPAASMVKGKTTIIRKSDTSFNLVTVSIPVNGVIQRLVAQHSWMRIYSDGVSWLLDSTSHQDSFFGSIKWQVNVPCDWIINNNVGVWGFSSDADCASLPREVYGKVIDSSNGALPKFGMPQYPGHYRVVMTGDFHLTNVNYSNSSGALWRLYDGTTQVGQMNRLYAHVLRQGEANNIDLAFAFPNLEFSWDATTSANKVLELQAQPTGYIPQIHLSAASVEFKITVYYYPSTGYIY